MYSPTKKLKCDENFNFPFQPYEIQQELMKNLYDVIENKQIGIFESPTGTGKSLTLTCGALKWLLDHDELVKVEINEKIAKISLEIKELQNEEGKSFDWIETQYKSMQKKDEAASFHKLKAIMDDYDKKLEDLKQRKQEEKLKKIPFSKLSNVLVENQSFTLEQPEEEDLSLEDVDEDLEELAEKEDQEKYRDVKIYFCSRTHSQLAQVVREIKRSFYGTKVRCVSLASRQNLCINHEVKKLPSNAMINERCLDMQKSQSKKTSVDSDGRAQKKTRLKQTSKCPYKNQAVDDLRDSSLIDILDIEDLVTMGKTLKTCPYYSSREAVKDAQVVMLPYQLLFHKRTRQQTGIDLRSSIIIIDEAHNLLDAISSIYSAEISLFQLQTAVEQLSSYKTKYFSRFNTKNILKINQLLFVTKRLVKLLSMSSSSSRMLKTHELMSEGEFFNINLYEILDFCEKVRLAQKVHGLAQRNAHSPPQPLNKENERSGTSNLLRKLEEQANSKKRTKKNNLNDIEKASQNSQDQKTDENKSAPSVIRPLLAFLESLTECADDGRVLLKYNEDVKKCGMKFILLNPGGHFEEMLKECRSIIIAGGTMQPTSDITEQLFKTCSDRVRLHFFGHVVPAESVLPFAVPKGPTGKRFSFNFTNRNNPEMLAELGMTLQNVCNVVPAGIVCFFSSYDYLDTVYTHLNKNQVLSNIESKKYVFREPRAGTGQSVDKILVDYSTAIKDSSRNGALLLSVVGGKLSEGLNFSDDLGRCVIVVGMPYPNKTCSELQEKIKHMESTLGKAAGSEYYDNLCIKAVNQCIGRSVRHINDYACVLLVDERYTSDRVVNKLPKWISRSLKIPSTFGVIQGSIAKFFRQRKQTEMLKDK